VTPLLPLLALLAAASPFEAEHPEVRAGNQALQAGDPAAALPRYEAAERDAGQRAEIDFDRGNALQQAGRTEEARAAWRRAAEKGPATLASRALQNTASALDAAGDRAGAIRALGEALQRDPANEDARYNLEVLLRRKAEGKGAPKEEGQQGKPKPDGQQQQGAGGDRKDQQDQGPQEAQPDQKPGQQQPAGQSPDQRKEQERRDAGTSSAGDSKAAGRDGAAGRREPLGKQDAERLLDAMRSRERTMPLAPAGPPSTRRETGRDW
jgi:Ca-activated chloride channel family protein